MMAGDLCTGPVQRLSFVRLYKQTPLLVVRCTAYVSTASAGASASGALSYRFGMRPCWTVYWRLTHL